MESKVSELASAALHERSEDRLAQRNGYRPRPLGGRYPYLGLAARVEKVGAERTASARRPLVVAWGVHETGRRGVLGTDVGEAESEAFWREFVRSLVARGLSGVCLCISDAHVGLKKAIAQGLGCPWSGCTVHFLRDMQGHVGKAQQQNGGRGHPAGVPG